MSLAAVDQIGWQPIDYAAANGQLEMAQWLAQQPGVSLTAEDNTNNCRHPIPLPRRRPKRNWAEVNKFPVWLGAAAQRVSR